MKKVFLTLLLTTYYNIYSQNLFFIGDKSYPATETFSLMDNNNFDENNMLGLSNLDVLIAKTTDGAGYLVLSKKTMTGVIIRGKVLIYLDDGTVITCVDKGKYDFVDETSTTIYSLNKQELEKMKNSNLNTIRYSLKCGSGCLVSTEEGSFTASNKSREKYSMKIERIDVTSLVNELFN
jgi:hypothetical protein